MPIYLWLDIGSFLIPFLFSFHPKLRFDKKWPYILPGILVSLVVYIIWDILFTRAAIWGFAPEHLIGIDILGLPIEEWLFFICIPYACLFTHHCLGILRPSWKVPARTLRWLVISLTLLWLILAFLHMERMYTLVNFLWAIPLILITWKMETELLQRFIISYVIILFPFLVVNGILTGTALSAPIVWYNDMENLGVRVGTIPVEDFTYAFTMLLFPLFIAKRLKGG